MKRFNVRVYGIYISPQQQILLSDERIGDFCFTKFPGGGLEFGEGLHEALIREWKEELNTDIRVGNHIYTTDFFQISAFDKESQIISVYYYVEPLHALPMVINDKPNPYHYQGDEEQHFRFLSLDQCNEVDLTLPIDKRVIAMLKR